MKKITISKPIFGLMAIAMLLCSIPLFSGCGETQYTYSEFQLAYQDFVEEYTGEIFDENGYIDIIYENDQMNTYIRRTDLDTKLTKVTRLIGDTNSDQAIFEPTLKATMLYVRNYINVTTGINVPTSASTSLYNSLQDLINATDDFVYSKHRFDNSGSFNPENAIDQTWLEELLDDYANLVVTANNFSKQFIDAFERYNVSDDTATRPDGRPAIGSIDKFFLKSLTSLADVYINVYLVNIYDKSGTTSITADNGDHASFEYVEAYTYPNYCADINSALDSYMDIADTIQAFENKEGTPTSQEQSAITTFNSVRSYEYIFQNGYEMTLEALEHYDASEENVENLNTTELGYRAIVTDFFNCEYKNLTNMLNELSEKIVLAS